MLHTLGWGSKNRVKDSNIVTILSRIKMTPCTTHRVDKPKPKVTRLWKTQNI